MAIFGTAGDGIDTLRTCRVALPSRAIVRAVQRNRAIGHLTASDNAQRHTALLCTSRAYVIIPHKSYQLGLVSLYCQPPLLHTVCSVRYSSYS